MSLDMILSIVYSGQARFYKDLSSTWPRKGPVCFLGIDSTFKIAYKCSLIHLLMEEHHHAIELTIGEYVYGLDLGIKINDIPQTDYTPHLFVGFYLTGYALTFLMGYWEIEIRYLCKRPLIRDTPPGKN